MYGIQNSQTISESAALDPLSPYAETKMFLEKLLGWYGSAYGLKSACLRYFNAAGADPDCELGECHQPETHLIPLALQAAANGTTLRVFGNDYATADGTAIRDYIHVNDLADAHVLSLRHLLDPQNNSFVANLGTGRGHSVAEVINMVEQVTGKKISVQYCERRQGDAPRLVADPTHAQNLLDWQPQHSSLQTIVQTAWNWYLKN